MMRFALSFLTSLAAVVIPLTVLPGFTRVSPSIDLLWKPSARGEVAQAAKDDRALTDTELDSALEQIREPGDAVLLAVFFIEQADYEMAITLCNRAIELDPNYSHAYSIRGLIYSTLKQDDRAIASLSRAIELNPNLVGAHLQRGRVYYERQEYEQSLADYDRAIEIYSDNAEAYNSRGNVYLARQEYDRAIADFNKSIELSNPAERYLPYRNRGLAYYYQQQDDKALADFERAIELKPD